MPRPVVGDLDALVDAYLPFVLSAAVAASSDPRAVASEVICAAARTGGPLRAARARRPGAPAFGRACSAAGVRRDRAGGPRRRRARAARGLLGARGRRRTRCRRRDREGPDAPGPTGDDRLRDRARSRIARQRFALTVRSRSGDELRSLRPGLAL